MNLEVIAAKDISPLQPAQHAGAHEIVIAAACPFFPQWEWKCLFETLDRVGWKVREKPVKVKILGEKFRLDWDKPVDVQYLGLHGQKDTIEILGTIDILYCPQVFSREMETEVRSQLPAELLYFLASGRPIVLHAPEYAAATQLLKPKEAAAFSQSSSPVNIELYNCLDRLTFDSDFYSSITKNARELFDNNFESISKRPTGQTRAFIQESA